MPYPDDDFSLDVLLKAGMEHPLNWVIYMLAKENSKNIPAPANRSIIDEICVPALAVILWSADYLHRVFIKRYPLLNPLSGPPVYATNAESLSAAKVPMHQKLEAAEKALNSSSKQKRVLLDVPCFDAIAHYIDTICVLKAKPCHEFIMYPVLQNDLPELSCMMELCDHDTDKWMQAKLSAVNLINAKYDLETEALIELILPERWRALLNDPSIDEQVYNIRDMVGTPQENINCTEEERLQTVAILLKMYKKFQEMAKTYAKIDDDSIPH